MKIMDIFVTQNGKAPPDYVLLVYYWNNTHDFLYYVLYSIMIYYVLYLYHILSHPAAMAPAARRYLRMKSGRAERRSQRNTARKSD